MTVDPRFYAPVGALTLGQIAELTGATLHGDAAEPVTGISAAAGARAGDLVFLDGDGKSMPELSPHARLFIVNDANVQHVPAGAAYLLVRFPRFAHATAALAMYRPRHLDWTGEDRVSADASIHDGVRISPGAVIGPGATIRHARCSRTRS